jgi:hypothetical protein
MSWFPLYPNDMFDLDQAIAEWRRQMAADGIRNPALLDELENHLREETEAQMRSGLAADRAFAQAVERIGDAARLCEEFEKSRYSLRARKRHRERKGLLAYALFAGLILEPGIFAFSSSSLRQQGIETTIGDWLLVLGNIIPMLLSIPASRWVVRFLPIIISERLRVVAMATVAFAGALLLRGCWSVLWADNLLHMMIIVLWTISPWIGFAWCAIDWDEKCDAARWQSRAVAG